MPKPVEQLAVEPIVCITFTDDVKAEALAHAYLDSVEAAAKRGEFVYRIFDFRFAHNAYASIFTDLLALVQNLAGAAVTPTLQAAFVGQPYMTDFFVGQQVAFFEDMDDAIAHAQSLTAEAVLEV